MLYNKKEVVRKSFMLMLTYQLKSQSLKAESQFKEGKNK